MSVAVPSFAQTFSSPLFKGQDPYVTFWKGNYYYSEATGNRIRVRKSPTLTGLKDRTPFIVYTAPRTGPDGHANLWAPEIHQVDGKWYIYFAADYDSSGRHWLYVLEGGPDPLDPYHPGLTGSPDGKIAESTGHWAIDPNVFLGPDAKLYLTWSCTDDDLGHAPQNLCIARMSDPLHTATATVRIATPTEPWETRTGQIEEGPVGFLHDGAAYITYSASASWTPNDYTAGVLVNRTGDLLNPTEWEKRGPIFDRHGRSYGPGSVVFVPSPDGTELWNVYHAYDRPDCAAWSCRSIRMQKVSWDADGCPRLGYPLDPNVASWVPSGDTGSSTGWGNSQLGADAAGAWTYHGSAAADIALGDFSRTFRGDPNLFAFTVSANVQLQTAGGQAGIFALYRDEANHAEAFLDAQLHAFVTRAIAAGVDQGSNVIPLPEAFDFAAVHQIAAAKSAAGQFTFSLDGTTLDTRSIPLGSGQSGLLAVGAGASFRDFAVADTSYGWGDTFGDAAQGLSQNGGGYMQGLWDITDAAGAASASLGAGWHTLYQGNPNFGSYTVRVEAQLTQAGTTTNHQRYGLIACHDDRNNRVVLWLDPKQGTLQVDAMVRGQNTFQTVYLPAGFDPAQSHALSAAKSGPDFTFYLDGSPMVHQSFALANGAAGVVTEDALVSFRNFAFQHR